jgi:hypothetical protein
VHFASYDPGEPVFECDGLALSLQLVTLENVYGADRERCAVTRRGERWTARATALAWAGQQERADGELELDLERTASGRWRARIRARAPERIRCVKLLVRNLEAPLTAVDPGGAARPIGPAGDVLAYPNRLPTPLLCARAGGESWGFRAADGEVREKRFALAVERLGPFAGRGVAELIHEEDARRFAHALESPPFEIARGVDPAVFEADHIAWLERAHCLTPFEARRDVPAWARDLGLVLTLHGMHWSGRVFLDYAAMLDVLRFVAERIDPRRVLAYLPGWEGRYYWQYGDYRPEPRLGGEAGFARLCDGARALGAHLMPMFGGNCVNTELARWRHVDPAAYLKSASGNRFHGNQPDWDFARAHDTGWQAWLNPGHPGFRDALAAQIEALAARFGFDGVFLDTIHVWQNDPHHSVYEGTRALVERLRARIPGVLLAAEHDYDALLPLFPLFQRAYWGRDPAWTGRYARRFLHLCEGEPEGRTGVHEFGVWPRREPLAADCIATLAFQDDTLARSRPALEAALADARRRARA